MDEAPEDELFEDVEGPEPCPESQELAPEAKCARSEATEQPHRVGVKALTGLRALLPGRSPCKKRESGPDPLW